MKNIKKVSALFLSVLLISAFLSCLTIFEASATELRYSKTIINQMSNSKSLNYAYDQLVAGFKSKKAEIKFDTSYNISLLEIETVFNLVLRDYPEFFYIDIKANYSVGVVNDISVSSLEPAYLDNIDSKTKALNNKIKELTKDLSAKSDYEKALILHDRLSAAVEYKSSANDQTAYGALVEGKAVCAGYSRAYDLLLHEVDIPAWSVMGTSINPQTNQAENHEWTMLQIDNEWYFTDVTWDDQDEILFYAYFNGTRADFDKTHFVDDAIKNHLPKATSTKANYFYKNNMTYQNVDINKIASFRSDNIISTRIFVLGNIKNFENELKNKFTDIAIKAGLQKGWNYTANYNILGNEIVLTMNFIDPNHICKTILVKEQSPTCTSKGTKAYYKCECGKWFNDDAAQSEITDKNSITLSPLSHKASNWKSNATAHYKECTMCGTEFPNSSEKHTDTNADYKCDTCGFSLPKPQPIQTDKDKSPVSSVSQNDITKNEESSSVVLSEQEVTEEISSDEIVIEPNTPNKQDVAEKKPKNKILLPILIAVGVILIGGGAATAIFFIKRKNN